MIVWLLACTGDDGGGPAPHPGHDSADHDSADHDSGDTGHGHDDGDPRPELTFPPELEDLDPAEGTVRVALEAALATHRVDGEDYAGYAYNGGLPGPTVRARVGDTVVVDFTNALDVETTVHWHGLAAPNAMDGATWVQAPIPPLQDYTYTLPVDRPGTFWYHPHMDVDHQVDRGLYGAFVVEDPAEPAVDRDLVLVFDTWGEVEVVDDHGLATPDDQTWTVNGLVDPILRATGGERLRVRLVNASISSYLDLPTPGRVIATDQGLAAGVEAPERLVLAPGDRAELEWLVGETGWDLVTTPYTAAGGATWGHTQRLLSVEVEAPAAAPDPLDWGMSGEPPSDDPTWTDLTYVFSGGVDGASWLINGESWPDVTLETVPLGEPTIVEARNLSATEHPFHLHGNALEVLSVDGAPPAFRTVEDTFNLPIRSTVRFRLQPDNPGDWMLHCHLLQHEEGGMMTVLRVE